MKDLAPFCANPWLWPRPCSSPFGLSLHSQSQPSVEAPVSAPRPHAYHQGMFPAGEYSKVVGTVFAVFSVFHLQRVSCCSLPWVFEVPYLSWLISQTVTGVPRVREPSPFFSSLPGVQVSYQFLFFHVVLPGNVVTFLVALVVWDLQPVSSRYSVRLVPDVVVFLMCLWEEVSSISFCSAIFDLCPLQMCIFKILFSYLFLAVLGLCWCMVLSNYGKQGLLSSCSVQASHCGGFLLQSTGSRAWGLLSCGTWAQQLWLPGSVVMAHGLSCPVAHEIFLDQGLNPCLLH